MWKAKTLIYKKKTTLHEVLEELVLEVLGLSNVKQKHTTKVTLACTCDLQVIRLIRDV